MDEARLSPGTPEAPTGASPFTAPSQLDPATPPVADFKDRGTGLVVFGIIQIILGLLTALMIPFMMLGIFISRVDPGGRIHPAQAASGVLTYGCVAAAFIALGIGSIRMQRWARALTLVASWCGLIMGVLVTILLTAVMPVAMRGAMAQAQKTNPGPASPELTTGIMAVIVTIFIVFAALFLIVIPIAFVVFYGRDDVARTVRQRDPVERWTDRAPLPVLGASVVMLTGALYMWLAGVSTPLFPFFGRYLTGIAGGACFVVLGAVEIYLAIGIFRLRASAWWTAVLLTPLRLISMILTYARADLMGAFSKLGFSDSEIQMMNSTPMMRSRVILWWSLLSMFLFFGYLLWLKRFFKTPDDAQPAALVAPAGSVDATSQ